MRSKFLSLNTRDFIKGLVLAFLTALITGVYELLQAGPFELNWLTFKPIVLTAVGAVLAYLIKNFLTNTQGKILEAEPK